MASSHQAVAAIPMLSNEHHGAAPSLLTFPTEIRIRIYSFLFDGITLSPAWRDLGRGSLRALEQQSNSPQTSLINFLGIVSDFDLDPELQMMGDYDPQRPRYPADLGILRSCRKIYNEAYPVLFRTATFSVASVEDHLRLTQPHMLQRLGRIRRLSVASSVLVEWSSTLIRLVSPSVSHFEIRDLDARLRHDGMLHVDSLLLNPDGTPQNGAPATAGAIMNLTQELMLRTAGSSLLASIVSHFTAAADLYECLVLHFRVECEWQGMMNPHEHPAKHIVFVFGDPQSLAQGTKLSTLPVTWRHETAFVFRSGFSLT